MLYIKSKLNVKLLITSYITKAPARFKPKKFKKHYNLFHMFPFKVVIEKNWRKKSATGNKVGGKGCHGKRVKGWNINTGIIEKQVEWIEGWHWRVRWDQIAVLTGFDERKRRRGGNNYLRVRGSLSPSIQRRESGAVNCRLSLPRSDVLDGNVFFLLRFWS